MNAHSQKIDPSLNQLSKHHHPFTDERSSNLRCLSLLLLSLLLLLSRQSLKQASRSSVSKKEEALQTIARAPDLPAIHKQPPCVRRA
jgi:hypothetical protein